MKLQNFLIGIGLFAVFTITIFNMIDTSNENGIYNSNYLNITHDTSTANDISNISKVGDSTEKDFITLKGDAENFSGGGQEPSESNLVGAALKVLINIPKSFTPIIRILVTMEEKLGIPPKFTQWAIGSLVIIVILILLGSFLKNRLEG